jgi:hypothetical protein
MKTVNHFYSRLLVLAVLAGLLLFVAFHGSPARAAMAESPASDSSCRVLNGPDLRAVQDSLLLRYPFLRRIQTKDAGGRRCDIFGRPVGC